MAALTNHRREKYCLNRISGMTQTDAYFAAGFEVTNGNAAGACASRLEADPEVRARIDELNEGAVKKAELKRADVLVMLYDTIKEARDNRQSSAAIRGIELLGKETNNMFVEKREVKTGLLDDGTDIGELERLREAVNAEATRRAAEANRESDSRAENRDVLSQYGIIPAGPVSPAS